MEPVKWLESAFLIKVVIASMVVWRWTGYNAIIYLAGLQAIPNDLYEAAKIDGANTVQQFLPYYDSFIEADYTLYRFDDDHWIHAIIYRTTSLAWEFRWCRRGWHDDYPLYV